MAKKIEYSEPTDYFPKDIRKEFEKEQQKKQEEEQKKKRENEELRKVFKG